MRRDPSVVALAGGGTGGHLFPGMALAEELQLRGVEVIGIGPTPATGEWIRVPSPRLPSSVRGAITFPFLAARAYRRSREILGNRPIRAVVGLGGYGSFFVGLAARRAGIPLFLLEQNAIPGRVTRILSRHARAVFAPWRETGERLPDGARLRLLGNPVRAHAMSGTRTDALHRWGFRRDRPTLLVMGGSQGAMGLNRRVLDCLESWRGDSFQVIHLTGPTFRTELEEAYVRAGLDARVLSFLDSMGAAYAAADLVLCRAGGTTIAEICARGIPSVLVPFPYASERHQDANARQVAEAGAGWLIAEGDLGPVTWRRIVGLLLREEDRIGMGRRARGLGRPAAAREIATAILEETSGNRGRTLPSPAAVVGAATVGEGYP